MCAQRQIFSGAEGSHARTSHQTPHFLLLPKARKQDSAQ